MNQDLRRTLWAAADKLRANTAAAEYKHLVLGLNHPQVDKLCPECVPP